MSAKRPSAAVALHKGSTKAELDQFLEMCGATAPNPYTVEEIFGAVTSAMWDAVVGPSDAPQPEAGPSDARQSVAPQSDALRQLQDALVGL